MAQHLATTDLPPLPNERQPYAYNQHLSRVARSHKVVREAQRMLQVEDELDHTLFEKASVKLESWLSRLIDTRRLT
jgi:hypothetical protein